MIDNLDKCLDNKNQISEITTLFSQIDIKKI